MRTLRLGEQTLAYRDEGSGRALMMLSANPGDSRDFDAVAPVLARRYRVIRPDWPGYGSSPAPQPPERAGASYFLETLAQLVQALELRDLALLGNSVGANVAVRFALREPGLVRGLVLVSPGGFTKHNAVTRLFSRLQGRPSVNRLVGGVFARSYLRVRNPHTREMIERAMTEQDTETAHAVNAAVWRSFLEPEHNLLERAQSLATPVLVVSGALDRVIPAKTDGRFAAEAIPGSRQIVLNSGHAPFAEVPEEFLAAIGPFLAGLEPPEAVNAARPAAG